MNEFPSLQCELLIPDGIQLLVDCACPLPNFAHLHGYVRVTFARLVFSTQPLGTNHSQLDFGTPFGAAFENGILHGAQRLEKCKTFKF